ncbi:MAG: phage major capsid protein, partial [Ktedonobacterales bacterium]
VKFWRKGAHVLTEAESKALSIADSAHAGYLVPDEIRGPIIERLVLISQFRPLVTQYTISSEAAKVPVERGQYAAYMISESGTRTESQSSEIGEERIPVHEGVALVVVSNQLLEDAAFPLDAYIQRKAAERIAKLQGQKFVSGTGRGEPEGILTNGSVAYVPTTDAALLKPDAFITMAHQLQTYYAQNAKWGMNRKTVGIIRGFKDSQNRYLWEPAVPNGNPAQILGIPYVELPDMPDVASNAFPVVLGDFESGYNWIDRIQMEMQRLTDSTYALKGQVGFLFRTRFGGQTVLAEAMLKMKVAVS